MIFNKIQAGLLLISILVSNMVSLEDWTFISYFADNNNLAGKTSPSVISACKDYDDTKNCKIISLVADQNKKTRFISNMNPISKHGYYYACMYDQMPSCPLIKPTTGNVDTLRMNNPENLEIFLKWAIDKYPSKNYFILLENHGAGYQGVCSDDNGSYNKGAPYYENSRM